VPNDPLTDSVNGLLAQQQLLCLQFSVPWAGTKGGALAPHQRAPGYGGGAPCLPPHPPPPPSLWAHSTKEMRVAPVIKETTAAPGSRATCRVPQRATRNGNNSNSNGNKLQLQGLTAHEMVPTHMGGVAFRATCHGQPWHSRRRHWQLAFRGVHGTEALSTSYISCGRRLLLPPIRPC
jgi:hypothetical protein